jgi:choline-sulfatase
LVKRILDSPWLYFGLAGLLLALAVVSQLEIQLPSRPQGTVEDLASLAERAAPEGDLNVLFIVIDTLRSDRLGSYGYERDTSPVMDLLAQHGVRFADVRAHSSWTKTSMASLWTGTYPMVHGLLDWSHVLPTAAKLPAESFAERGFRTGGLIRNGWVGANMGFGQGFGAYYLPKPNASPERYERNNPSTGPLTGTDEDITLSAIEFLRGYPHERFFLYLHYMDVHQYTYDESSALFGTSYSDAYDNAIRWTDRNIAEVLEALDDQGRSDSTLIVIASDHGEEFGEHRGEGHAKTLYEEVVRVPWIIMPPFALDQPIVVEAPAQNVDIWPTLYDMLGWDPPHEADGISMFPAILAAGRGEASPVPPDRERYATLNRWWGDPDAKAVIMASVTRGSQRLIRGLTGDELYDHAKDPGESRNLVGSNGDAEAELTGLLEEYLATEERAFGTPPTRTLREVDLNQLKALGYVIQ